MDSVLQVCGGQLAGWYDSVDRLRVGGIPRSLQQAGAVVNFMKDSYPGEERPLGHFPERTGRLKAGVEVLVARGVPYLEAKRASDPAVQAWLEPLYAAGPRAGSVVAIVRTIEEGEKWSEKGSSRWLEKGSSRWLDSTRLRSGAGADAVDGANGLLRKGVRTGRGGFNL